VLQDNRSQQAPKLVGPVVKTPEGLIIPAAAFEPERKIERWLNSEWKKYRRVFRDLLDKKISLAMLCEQCKVRIQPVMLADNKIALRCNCTDRVITKGV